MRPRHRIACTQPLAKGATVTLGDNAAHYLTHVLRLKEGDAVALFNGQDGEWLARLEQLRKKQVTLAVGELLRRPETALGLTVCFAPIKGGRLETILEKATELGACALQPVLTQRSVVDKVNLARAEAILREAAEQCERVGWPEIREPVKFMSLLGDWPDGLPLIYGDESGESPPICDILKNFPGEGGEKKWAVLTGPEGGFAPEEFAALRRVRAAHGVGLGPRILRADTAAITLCALTAAAWGDWAQRPRFERKEP
jgi:16S rRNA (uracil1498-N3)-methyltransferase